MTKVTFGPAGNLASRCVDRCHAPIESLRRRHAIGDMADARGIVPREHERVEFIIVKGSEINAVLVATALRKPVDANKEIEAFVEPVGVEFHVA